MKIALLGLAQAGKKTFFSLLTGRQSGALAKEGESLEGIAPIHDPRLLSLAKLCRLSQIKFAENNLVLCPDISPGAAKRSWLEAARRCDLLCVLVRAFQAAEVYHPLGAVDVKRDRDWLESELLLADLELIETRAARLAKEKKAGLSAHQAQEALILSQIKETLEREMRWVSWDLPAHEVAIIKSLNLLTLKPLLWAYNVDENSLADQQAERAAQAFYVSCRIEQEIMALENPEERQAYWQGLGVAASGLDRLNHAAYNALGLMSFYTVNKDEVRAWTIRQGTSALAAAGKVHSDIERGFIRVEVMHYEDFMAAGSEAAAKAQGKIQVRGQDYIIADGDICHFRFNV